MKKTMLIIALTAIAFNMAAQAPQNPQARQGQEQLTPAETRDVKKRYQSGERSAELVRKYAIVLLNSRARTMEEYGARGEKAATMVQEYFGTLDTKARLNSENYFIYELYTNSMQQPSARFLMNSKTKFPATMRTKIDKVIEQAVANDVRSYFTGARTVNEADIKTLKADIAKQKLNADGKYDTALKFIDARVGKPIDQYMDFCKQNLSSLSEQEQTQLFGSFSNVARSATQQEREQAAKFLRSILPQLEIEVVYQTIGEIVKLEKVEQ